MSLSDAPTFAERRAGPRIPFRQSVIFVSTGTTPVRLNGTIKDLSDYGVFLTVEADRRLDTRSVPAWLRRRSSPLAFGLTEGSEAFILISVPKSHGDGHYRYRAFGQVVRLKEELPPARFSIAMRFSTPELELLSDI